MRLCRLARPPSGCASGINGFGFEFSVQASRQWKSCNLVVVSMASPPLRLQHCPRLQGIPHWAFTCRGFFFLLLDGCFPETFSDCGFSSGLPWARAQNCFKLWPEISIFIKDFQLLESIALATAIGLRVLKPIAMATAIDLPWPRQSSSAPLDRLPWLRQSIPTKKNRFSVPYNRLLWPRQSIPTVKH